MPKKDDRKAQEDRDRLARQARTPTLGASQKLADRRRQTDELARKIFETDKRSQDIERLK